MAIPNFPDSRELVLEDKAIFDRLFVNHPPEISAYTFSNLFSWREQQRYVISLVRDMVMVWSDRDAGPLCLQPFGKGDTVEAIKTVLHQNSEKPAMFHRIHADVAATFSTDTAYRVEANRDDFDYLYQTADLADLPGKRYDGKRNFVKRFKSEYNPEYLQMTGETCLEAIAFSHRWCQERSCEKVEGMRKEHCAVYQMLTNFDNLKLQGGAIRVGGEIVAFSLGEALNPDTLVCHVEKGDTDLTGVYQAINNDFAIHEGIGFSYINREQDLGVKGLRKAKESYHPTRLVEAWSIARAERGI